MLIIKRTIVIKCCFLCVPVATTSYNAFVVFSRNRNKKLLQTHSRTARRNSYCYQIVCALIFINFGYL